jgi:hypothetical protein
VEYEKNLFFMDTSNLDEKQKEYINLMCDQVSAQKRMMGEMGAPLEGYGGIAFMGRMGAPIGGYGGIGSIGAMGRMSGVGGMSTIGGMSSMGGIGSIDVYGSMGGIGAIGGIGGMRGRFMASMAASMISMPTRNDGFVPSKCDEY